MNLFRRNLKRVDTTETASALEKAQMTALAFGLRQFGTPHPDEIARQRGRGIYQDMVDTDPQVKLSVKFKQLATLAPGWDILPYNEEPIHQETAEFVHDTLTNLKVSMDRVLLSVLDGLVDGFSVNELVYERIKSGEWNGRIGFLSELTIRHGTTTLSGSRNRFRLARMRTILRPRNGQHLKTS